MPALVWWITALHVALMLAYSILLPAIRSPDEFEHADLAHIMSEQWSYPAWDELWVTPAMRRTMSEVEWQTGSAHLREADAAPKDQRPSLEQLNEPPIATTPNPISQHPPLYYLTAAAVERGIEVVTGDPSWDVEVWVYRLVSILLSAPLPLVIWQVARRLGLPRTVGIAATALPLAIPELTRIESAANNDNLMLLMFAMLAPVVIRLAGGDLRPRVGVLAGVISGAALLTKGFALVIPLWVAAALLVAWRRGGKEAFRPTFLVGAVYGATTLAVGGWWWVRNLVLFKAINPSVVDAIVPEPGNLDIQWRRFVELWADRTTQRFWGDFSGGPDTHLPGWLFGLATVICLVGIAAGCRRRDRVADVRLAERCLLAAPLLLLVVTQFAFAFRGYLKSGTFPGMQGRYLFGAVASMSVIVLLGLANLVRGHRWLPLSVLVGVCVMQATAIPRILAHFWGEPGSPMGDQARAMIAWAPLPGELIGAGALVGALVLAGTLVQAGREALRPDAPRLPSDHERPPVDAATATPVMV